MSRIFVCICIQAFVSTIAVSLNVLSFTVKSELTKSIYGSSMGIGSCKVAPLNQAHIMTNCFTMTEMLHKE